MIAYEEFLGKVLCGIRCFLPHEYSEAEVSLREEVGEDGSREACLVVSHGDGESLPAIPLGEYYERLRSGMILVDVLFSISSRLASLPSRAMPDGWETDITWAKGRIVCRLLNAKRNESYLMDKPHLHLEDLAVSYAVDLGQMGMSHPISPITYQMMEKYGLDLESLNRVALRNLAREKKDFRSMRSVILSMMFPEGIKENDPMPEAILPRQMIPEIYVLTSKDKAYGASACLDRATMDAIAHGLGGDFLVLPSSVHEVLALPMRGDCGADKLEAIEAIIKDVNEKKLKERDILSDHAYRYDASSHRLVRMKGA